MLREGFEPVLDAADVMRGLGCPWFVCGGWAIDLFLGRVTRPHKDVDLGIWRGDQLEVQGYLAARGWTLEKAVDGRLLPWVEGEYIPLPEHVIWCRHDSARPGFIEILFNEKSGEDFVFRRDPGIRMPLRAAIWEAASGLRVLAPEIALLYKANDLRREENRADFESALRCLGKERREWLAAGLRRMYGENEWLGSLWR